jgi:hypothetical protein
MLDYATSVLAKHGVNPSSALAISEGSMPDSLACQRPTLVWDIVQAADAYVYGVMVGRWLAGGDMPASYLNLVLDYTY